MWKYVWMKKYVEMREMLFKNWKWLFENTNQTPQKFLKVWKSNNWKVFHNYNFVLIKWWVQFYVLTLLQKSAPLILSFLWYWIKCEISSLWLERWIKRSLQWISSFEFVRDLSFFKFFMSFECSLSFSKVLRFLVEILRYLRGLIHWTSII